MKGGEEGRNSSANPYGPLLPISQEVLRDAPRRRRSAALLRLAGQDKKADAEANCGVPLKGRCQSHGVVRGGRSSGKTPWCAGCNTETSAKYLRTTFPASAYSILGLQRHLGTQGYDAAELEPCAWEIDPADGDRITALIEQVFQDAAGHFRRVKRRFGHECLAWHFAVGQGREGLWVELQVLVRRKADSNRVLAELTGGTRKDALSQADTVVRYDYREGEGEQLRRDWAGPLKCALLRLDDDVLFAPIFFALKGKQLSMAYGDLRQALQQGREATRGQREEARKCPVVSADAKLCGQKLTFFLDPEDKHPVNPLVYQRGGALARAGPPGR